MEYMTLWNFNMLMDLTMLIYLVLADWICYRASMDLQLLIDTQTCCCERVRFAATTRIGIHKSHSRSRQVELGEVEGFRGILTGPSYS